MLDLVREGMSQESFLTHIFSCLVEDISPEELVEAAKKFDDEKLCEAYYYAGEVFRLKNGKEEALALFQKCVETGLVFDPDKYELNLMNEYHLAKWRLKQLSGLEPVSTVES